MTSGRFGHRPRSFAAAVLAALLALAGLAVTSAPASAGELLQNGGFDDGTVRPWWSTENTAISVQDGALRADAPGGTANVWDAMVGQSGVDLVNGAAYTLSFDASAAASTEIHVRVQEESAPYAGVLDRQITLGTTAKRFTFPFTSTLTIGNGQVLFQLGGRTEDTTVHLDNISLTTGGGEPGNPLEMTDGFYIDLNSNPAEWVRNNGGAPEADIIQSEIASKPMARWFGDWTEEVPLENHVGNAAKLRRLPVVVAYNMFLRDCGGASKGGAGSPAEYRAWISRFAERIGDRPAIVILEPDATAHLNDDCLNDDEQKVRLELLTYATRQLRQKATNTWTYLDAGNFGWVPAQDMAARLQRAGIENVRGFSVNVSNFYTTAQSIDYARRVNAALGRDVPFIVDTSRNGNGHHGTWCNPPEARLGTPAREGGGAEMLLWVKVPGDSDGDTGPCPPGSPRAGLFSEKLALGLIGDGAPDPAGAYPTPSTTGVPAGTGLTTHNGNYFADTPGEVIDGKRITGRVFATADGVTIRNSEIHGGVTTYYAGEEGSFTLTDSTVGPPSGCNSEIDAAISYDHYTARRVHVRNFSDAFRDSGDDIRIEDSYVRLCSNPGDHSDGIQAYKGGANVVVVHNTVDQRGVRQHNAPIFWADESKGSVLRDNLLAGGTYTVRLHGTGFTFTGNKIVDNAWQYGPVAADCDGIAWSGNDLVTIDAGYRITSTVGPLACS